MNASTFPVQLFSPLLVFAFGVVVLALLFATVFAVLKGVSVARSRRSVNRLKVTISRDAQDATGRPGMWLFLRLCTWEGITPVEQPTIRLGLQLWRQGQRTNSRVVLDRVGLHIEPA